MMERLSTMLEQPVTDSQPAFLDLSPNVPAVDTHFSPTSQAVLYHGDCLDGLHQVPNGAIKLIITSPPYNIGKNYEVATHLDNYLETLSPIVDESVRVLSSTGSLVWQVGNYVDKGEVFPLDILFYPFFKAHGLKLRNRVVWHFDHGLHASKRFSGRYETLLWFTKGDDYTFNLDPVRVPAKYPGKLHFKGDKKGQPSGNPLGKNPSDIWKVLVHDWETCLWDIPNVKANHPEKTIHPCQYPIELVERCVLSMTEEDDWVLDPFSGVASALLAALKNNRRGMGCERKSEYVDIARARIADLYSGKLGYRTLGKPVHVPTGKEKVTQMPQEWLNGQIRSVR